MAEQSEELLEELSGHLPCLETQHQEVEFLQCYTEACYWEVQIVVVKQAVVEAEAVVFEELVAAGLLE